MNGVLAKWFGNPISTSKNTFKTTAIENLDHNLHLLQLKVYSTTQLSQFPEPWWEYFCLFSEIPVISNRISMLLLAFTSTSSNFNNLLLFNLETNFSKYIFAIFAMIITFFSEILFIYFAWCRNKTYFLAYGCRL